MSNSDALPVWRFRLMLLTALAVLVLLVFWLRSRADITRVEKQRRAMIGTLRSLMAAQDAHQARTGRYAIQLDSLTGYTAPPELVLEFRATGSAAWSATVHDSTLDVAPTTCGLFVGPPETSPHRAVLEPGSPTCW